MLNPARANGLRVRRRSMFTLIHQRINVWATWGYCVFRIRATHCCVLILPESLRAWPLPKPRCGCMSLSSISGTYGRAGWGGRPSDGTNGWSARSSFSVMPPPGNPLGNTVPMGHYVYHADRPEDRMYLDECVSWRDRCRCSGRILLRRSWDLSE